MEFVKLEKYIYFGIVLKREDTKIDVAKTNVIVTSKLFNWTRMFKKITRLKDSFENVIISNELLQKFISHNKSRRENYLAFFM